MIVERGLKTEGELIFEYKNGSRSALEELFNRNEALVNCIYERHFRNCGCEKDDMLQEGRVGLMRAIEKFNPKYEPQFNFYKSLWIKQKMFRFRRNNFKIRFSRIGDRDFLAEKSRAEITRGLLFDLDNLISSGKVPEKKASKILKKL